MHATKEGLVNVQNDRILKERFKETLKERRFQNLESRKQRAYGQTISLPFKFNKLFKMVSLLCHFALLAVRVAL